MKVHLDEAMSNNNVRECAQLSLGFFLYLLDLDVGLQHQTLFNFELEQLISTASESQLALKTLPASDMWHFEIAHWHFEVAL